MHFLRYGGIGEAKTVLKQKNKKESLEEKLPGSIT